MERSGTSARLYLVRHGQTGLNKQRLLQGRSDSPLNREGIKQTKEARDFFSKAGIHFDLAYSSPLGRAVMTARVIAGNEAEIRLDDRLIEMDYGPYEGSSLEKPAPELVWFFRDFARHREPEGMESLASVTARMGEFLEEIRGSARGNILISTHAIAMKGALEYLTPDSGGAYWSRYIGNCGVYSFELEDGIYRVPREFRPGSSRS